MPKKSGFTLVELLITISIIGVLSAIGLVVFSNVLKQGRDAKRQSDLRAIQSALEQYYADQGYYPKKSDITTDGVLSTGNLSTGGKIYLNTIPADPINRFDGNSKPWYQYRYYAVPAVPTQCDNISTNKCTGYCLLAFLENSSNGTVDNRCTLPSGAYTRLNTNYTISAP